MVAGNNMQPNVWKLKRRAGLAAKGDPGVIAMRLNVAVGFKGIEDRAGFIFDAKNPDGWPQRLKLNKGPTVTRPVFDNVFVVNFLDAQGKNIYAQFVIDAAGIVRFNKWIDGGEGLNVTVVINDLTSLTVILGAVQ